METKWRINVNLLKNIFEVARRPKLASLKAANIKPSTWNGWIAAEAGEPNAYTKEAGGIPVRALIAICNVLGIPVSRMFVREGEDEVIPLRSPGRIPVSSLPHLSVPRGRTSRCRTPACRASCRRKPRAARGNCRTLPSAACRACQ